MALLSIGYVARRCAVNPKTVRRWIHTKRIAAFRLPSGHFRIEPSEMDRVLGQKYSAQTGHSDVLGNGFGPILKGIHD